MSLVEMPVADVQVTGTTINGCTLEEAKDRIKARYERQIAQEQEAAVKHFEGIAKLRAAGFTVEPYSFNSIWWRVKVTDLPGIRKAIGKLTVSGKHPHVNDDPDYDGPQMIEVTLRNDEYPSIKVEYLTPYKEGGKCKIVESVSTTKSLVCSI